MNILYINHNNNPTGLYRCVLPAYYLQKLTSAKTRGIGDIFESLAPKSAIGASIKMAEVIVFYIPFNDISLLMLDTAMIDDKLVIVEIDDCLHKIRDDNPASEIWSPENFERLDYAMRCADAITTTNERLAEFYSERFDLPVYVLPNQIDHTQKRWKTYKEEKDFIRLGWMGSNSHKEDVALLKDVLPEILRKYDNVQIEFAGMFPEWMEELQSEYEGQVVRQEYWLSLFDYPQEMAQFDIGLIPIADNKFNTGGKSDLKFLEYSMVGVPSIASDLYPYRETIEHNINGLLTENSVEDWVFQISRLVEDEGYREELSISAKNYVLGNRTYEKNIYRWYSAYRDELYKKQNRLMEERKKKEEMKKSEIEV